MDCMIARCAGLDVHKASVVACVRLPGPNGTRVSKVETFGTTTVDRCPFAIGSRRGGYRRRDGEHRRVLEASLLLLEDRFTCLSSTPPPRACARSQERCEGRGVDRAVPRMWPVAASFVRHRPFAIFAT